MNKKAIIHCVLILAAILTLTTSFIMYTAIHNREKPALTLDLPEETIKAGDTIYLRQIGTMLKAEHYHNYPDQQDKSRIYTATQ